MNQTCKHNNDKMKCEQCIIDKYGEVCEICKVRKGTFFASASGTSGGREGGRDSICKCNENN